MRGEKKAENTVIKKLVILFGGTTARGEIAHKYTYNVFN
jgi:hypothetical protein